MCESPDSATVFAEAGTANVLGPPIDGDFSGGLVEAETHIVARGLTPFQFGVFVTSTVSGPPVPVQSGNLSLAGPAGRFAQPGQIFQAGAAGLAQLEIDLTAMPTPNALVAANQGETWHFHAWHRDVVQGSLTSNFTGGASVQWQ